MMKPHNRFFSLFTSVKLNYDFLLLFMIVLITNAGYLAKNFVPVHDTLEVFTFFHYFYSEWFIRGEIPQWFPYSTYGVPTNFYQFRNISPIYYVFMGIGKILSITDALFLFKISVIAEQCVFLLGMYQLSRYLFKHRSTVFMVCLAAVASVVWHSAINFNFRLYAMFPMVVYCLLLFFEQRREGFLWVAGLFCLIGAMGVTIYFVGLWAFVYTLLAALLLLKNRTAFKDIFKFSRKNIFFFILFVSVAVLIFWYLKTAIHFVTLVSTERQASGATTLEIFLRYGRIPQFSSVLKGLFFGNADIKVGVPYDNTIYMGLLPLFFFLWSLFWVREAKYYIFLCVTVALVWMSFGGIFASWVYRFPALAYYRHIGHVYSLVKVLLLICAGYGIDHFWQASLKKKAATTGILFLFTLFIFDVFINVNGSLFDPAQGLRPFFACWRYFKDFGRGFFLSGPLKYFLLVAAFFSLLIVLQRVRRGKFSKIRLGAQLLIIMGIFLDLMIFQKIVQETIPKVDPQNDSWLKSAEVRVADYQKYRILDPVEPVHQDAYNLVMLSDPTAKYVSAYNFIQMDRCDPGFRVDLASHGVLELVSIPHIKRAIVGCYYPKMRLVPHAFYTDDILDLAKVAADFESFTKVVVLEENKEGRNVVRGDPLPDPRNTIEVQGFSPNKVTADVRVYGPKGKWLVYADAYNPNWKAFVNGKEVPVHRAYRAFKSIFLPPGTHTVVFRYGGLAWLRSLLLALGGLSCGLFLVFLFLRQALDAPLTKGKNAF